MTSNDTAVLAAIQRLDARLDTLAMRIDRLALAPSRRTSHRRVIDGKTPVDLETRLQRRIDHAFEVLHEHAERVARLEAGTPT